MGTLVERTPCEVLSTHAARAHGAHGRAGQLEELRERDGESHAHIHRAGVTTWRTNPGSGTCDSGETTPHEISTTSSRITSSNACRSSWPAARRAKPPSKWRGS